MILTSLKPNVTRDQAARRLKGALREMRRGRLAAVIDFYVPYHVFQVAVRNGERLTRSLLAIDAVTGQLDLYAFDGDPSTGQGVAVETTRAALPRLSEADSLAILKEKLKRGAYLKGFFKVKNLDVSGRLVSLIYVPYWVGLYRRNDRAMLEVIDAVRDSFEGAKLREVVAEWLRSPSAL